MEGGNEETCGMGRVGIGKWQSEQEWGGMARGRMRGGEGGGMYWGGGKLRAVRTDSLATPSTCVPCLEFGGIVSPRLLIAVGRGGGKTLAGSARMSPSRMATASVRCQPAPCSTVTLGIGAFLNDPHHPRGAGGPTYGGQKGC